MVRSDLQVVDGPLGFPRHGEVMSKHRCYLVQAVRRGCLQAPSSASVKLATLGPEHAPIGRFLDECVAEPVCRFRDLPYLGDQPCRTEPCYRLLQFPVDVCNRAKG